MFRKTFEERQEALKKAPINTARVGRLELAGPFDPDTTPPRQSLQAVYACGHLPPPLRRRRAEAAGAARRTRPGAGSRTSPRSPSAPSAARWRARNWCRTSP